MCHVLIIEDEPLVAMNIEMILTDAGATSFSFAATEDEAVEMAHQHHPTLITSDVKLESGCGPAAVSRILDALGPTPVIFITASPDECDPCRAPARILVKPVTDDSVTQAFHQLIRL
ncbi:histidine kinase [Sphingomonas sp. Leaf339]|uniref:response regulator n=1 Tax=Sphingomonas sp. Leaf339 TaxID=1736343 RepID=UPI0007007490|nr:response regulator [Sphingomonas sp. Leaf339]KQU61737.1 histidine kinase [Sphingomonas sp. Leaf339]